MSRFERFLRRYFPHKELGWIELGEKFTRFVLLRHPFGAVYLHKLDAPVWPPECHDHPWGFLAIILKGGYWEEIKGVRSWKRPGSVLWRPAETSHNVKTNGVNWSIVFVGKKKRDWGFHACETAHD